MKIFSAIFLLFILPFVARASDDPWLTFLKRELSPLVDGPGDVWAYSGKGGFIFLFEKDVLGDRRKEMFVNFSIRPDVWYVFTGEDGKKFLGEVVFPSLNFIFSRGEGTATIVSSYSADSYAEPPFDRFGKYVVEQIISETGVKKGYRKVGRDVSEDEFRMIAGGDVQGSEKYQWANPEIRAVTVFDFLTRSKPDWFKVDIDAVKIRNDYYFPDNSDLKIERIPGDFTPGAAAKSLNKLIGIDVQK